MARRVLTVHEITFREKHKNPKVAETLPVSNLEGEDLLDVFYDWASTLEENQTADFLRNLWIAVRDVRYHGPRVVIVELAAGSMGESGEVVDSKTGLSTYEITESHAATGTSRVLLLSPPSGHSAFFFAESTRRASAGTRIRTLFRQYVQEEMNTVKMEYASVTEGELWAQHAELKRVEVRVEGKTADIADGTRVRTGSLSHVARPEKKSAFPRDLLGALQKDKFIAHQIVSTPEEDEGEVYVTLSSDGREKTFNIEGSGAPSFRQVITRDGEPALSDMDLVSTCVDQLREITNRTGRIEWHSSWHKLT